MVLTADAAARGAQQTGPIKAEAGSGQTGALKTAPLLSLRIRHAGKGSLGAELARSTAEQGFSHVLLSPPWTCGRRGDAYLTADFTVNQAGETALPGLVQTARDAGLALLLDVVLDRLAAESPLIAAAGSPFAPMEAGLLLDPRTSEGADAAYARVEQASEAAMLAAWWLVRLREWHGQGVAGFRLLGLERFSPPALAAFLGALREGLPGCLLLAWTAGLARAAVMGLAGLGLDGVFASLPWWDWHADWLWEEVNDLLQVAPVLGVDSVPPGPGHLGAGQGARRNTALAALIGQGWMHVASDEEVDEAAIAALNAALSKQGVLGERFAPVLPLGDAAQVLGVLRLNGADYRCATKALLGLVHAGGAGEAIVAGASVLPALGGRFEALADLLEPGGPAFTPEQLVRVPAGEARLFAARALAPASVAGRVTAETARAAGAAPRLAIEMPTPAVDGGAFPVKAVCGETVSVEADIVFDGHEKINAALRWCGPDGAWHEQTMRPLVNDRWQGSFPLQALGRHAYLVMAWRDRFETFRDELAKKVQAGLRVDLEAKEGAALVAEAAGRSTGALRTGLADILALLKDADATARVAQLLSVELAQLMQRADDRPFMVETDLIPVDAERIGARFANWYEVFPRSLSDDEGRHGTFADVVRHLPRIAAMGFDVLYFPPISPIGRINRKGRNNTLTPAEDDPGSPYAIGSAEGGHDALHPQLGTFEDFAALRRAAAAHGLELAIDFAIQCSPDHPWLKQHPGWFDWRPDGTIRYAENPPKRYEDIVNVDFYAKDAVPELWLALCNVVLFWAEQGVRLFRVDNPHTKPFPFWEWMIGEVRERYPDAVFLAEAFTRPKIMYRLAKIGFSQSYTYFTWRNTKRELEAYLTELGEAPPRDFFRPHFFVNTPDINPVFLQSSGRPGFLIRAALAATLSGLWGVYNGFELCEAAAVPGKEEYQDSEKYQLRAWDWSRPGNIVAEITALNRIRRQHPALQTHLGVSFLPASNDAVMFYEKATADRSDVVLVAVSLDPHDVQEAQLEVPLWHWKLPDDASLSLQNLMDGSAFLWHGKYQHVRLTPEMPFAIWRARSAMPHSISNIQG